MTAPQRTDAMKSNVYIVEVPLFSRGRHTSPRSGGCLMELVGATVGVGVRCRHRRRGGLRF